MALFRSIFSINSGSTFAILCLNVQLKINEVKMDKCTNPEFLNVTDCSRAFGVSRSEIYALLRDGAIRAVRFGNRSLVDMETARAYFKKLPDVRLVPGSRGGVARWKFGPVSAEQ